MMTNKIEGVILAGGQGTRIHEVSQGIVNKPLLEIGGVPIIFHVAARYLLADINHINVLSGWMADEFEQRFWDKLSLIRENNYLNTIFKNAKFNLVESGQTTDTFERLRYLDCRKSEQFLITYGDTITNIDIKSVIDRSEQNGFAFQISATRPKSSYGVIDISRSGFAKDFSEKRANMPHWVSCGYFKAPSDLYSMYPNATSIELEVLPDLAKKGLLGVYKHHGIWLPIDTKNDFQQVASMMSDHNFDDLCKIPEWFL